MAVNYALVNKVLIDCGISEINTDHEEGKGESPQIWLIPNQEYRLIRMGETSIVADQSNDKYQ